MSTLPVRSPSRKVKSPPPVSLPASPLYPSVLFPLGRAGIVVIGEDLYVIEPIGELPPEGEPVVFGYRLRKDDGQTYDIPTDTTSCECLGFLRWHKPCKHIEAIRELRRKGDLV